MGATREADWAAVWADGYARSRLTCPRGLVAVPLGVMAQLGGWVAD